MIDWRQARRSFLPEALEALRQAARDFSRRWRAPLPPSPARGRLIGAVVLLLACVGAGDAALALVFDARVALAAASLPPFSLRIAEIVTRFGLSGYIFLLSALLCVTPLVLAARGFGPKVEAGLRLLAGRAFFVFCANLFSGIVGSQIIKHLVGRARPPLIHLVGPFHFEPLSFKSTLASFPSGHTITAFTTASALGVFAPKIRIPLYLLAIAVGISRLMLRAHYPSDVVAGAAIGMFSTWFVARAFARRRIVFVTRGAWIEPRGAGVILCALRATRRMARSPR